MSLNLTSPASAVSNAFPESGIAGQSTSQRIGQFSEPPTQEMNQDRDLTTNLG